MKNFVLTLSYDGSRYKGWQRLGNGENTIQAKLESVLSRMLDAPVEVSGSGRTDAGAHALGQVANFHADTKMTAAEVQTYLRKYLPEDIGVLSIREADERFHSRLCAAEKTYRYRMILGDAPCVFDRKYVWRCEENLDLAAMRRAAEDLIGTHDFAAFCSNKRMKKSTVRTVRALEIRECGDELQFFVTGDGFLYNMVRIMVGTLVEIGAGRRPVGDICRIFASRTREEAGFTVPAQGLCLMEVRYE